MSTLAGWLALRSEADSRTRSRELVGELVHRLGPGPIVVHDLGSGSGAMPRWLAPMLDAHQEWVLHDADAGILTQIDPEPVTDGMGRPIRTLTSVEQLADLPQGAFHGASLVTASALLDVITADETRIIVDACVAAACPALFSLSVTGRVELDPADPADADFGAAFNDHQRRNSAGRRLLGPEAAGVVARMFGAAGWTVRTVATPWRLGTGESELIGDWLDGWVGAAIEQQPSLGAAAHDYLGRRRAQIADDVLSVVVDHEDVIAWPR
ncbi:MAG: SAM-dependent methyltransferase [Actinomycetota bacterium]